MNKNELKLGEIYTHRNGNIVRYDYFDKEKETVCGVHIGNNHDVYRNVNQNHRGSFSFPDLTISTPKEKHWLETCIKQDKFVSYEDAMKTFIPEYVECINLSNWRQTIKENNGNLIFKSDFKSTCSVQILEVLPQSKHFKPSTKEAYDAQFELTELPKKWCISSKNMSHEIKKWFEKKVDQILFFAHPYYGNCPFNAKDDLNRYGGLGLFSKSYYDNIEITAEQFKKWILKEETSLEKHDKEVLANTPAQSIRRSAVVEESLLDKAKRLYPIGTEIYSAKHPTHKYKAVVYNHEVSKNNKEIYCINKNGKAECHLYIDNNWAEIISKPEIKIESKSFEILSIQNKNSKHILHLEKDGYYRSDDKRTSVFLPKEEPFPFFYDILEVSNKEGNIFMIGDVVKSTKVNTKGSKLLSFKMSAKGNTVLAITEKQINFGIGINHLEHYTEEKKHSGIDLTKNYISEHIFPSFSPETILEKAKRLYPVGTVFKSCYYTNYIYTVHKNDHYISTSNGIFCTISENSGTLRAVYNNIKREWAEIIGYEPQVGDHFQLRDFSYPSCGKNFQGKYTIVKFEGSYDNPNSVITFKDKNYVGDYTSTVLLKNIKIIK